MHIENRIIIVQMSDKWYLLDKLNDCKKIGGGYKTKAKAEHRRDVLIDLRRKERYM